VITGWFESPRAGHGIYLADDADRWSFREDPQLAASARRAGAGLRDAGDPARWLEAYFRGRTGGATRFVRGQLRTGERTSSGKPQRRRMWEILQKGLPEGAQIIEDPADAGSA
jgi:hypothetical protein